MTDMVKIILLMFMLNFRNAFCNQVTPNPIENEIEDSTTNFSLDTDKLSLDYLLRKCRKDSSISCIQRNIFVYFNNVLDLETINVTNNVVLKRNDDISYGEFNGSESKNIAKFTTTGMFLIYSFLREIF